MQKGKQPSRRPAGCLLPSLRPPGLPPAGRSPRHGPLVGRTEPGTLFKHGTAAGLRERGQLPLSFRSTPHTEDSAEPAHWRTRLRGSQAALVTVSTETRTGGARATDPGIAARYSERMFLQFIKNFLLGHLSEKRRKIIIVLLPSSRQVKRMPRMSPKNITLIFNFKNFTYCHQVQSPSEIHPGRCF